MLERPTDPGHGDLATNLAMVLAKVRAPNPRAVAERVIGSCTPARCLEKTEIAGPGFINFWLAQRRTRGPAAPSSSRAPATAQHHGRGLQVNVEFVSANPTGPLHVGHGRGAALGDGIAALLEWTGHDVTREFYINDAGVQIDRVGAEPLGAGAGGGWPPVRDSRGRLPRRVPEGKRGADPRAGGPRLRRPPGGGGGARCRALALVMQREEQDRDLASFGVRYDVMTSEQAFYDRGAIRARSRCSTSGASPSRATARSGSAPPTSATTRTACSARSDGSYTYFLPDIVYHVDKHERGFDRVIDVWGADHHGYIPRVRAALRALGYPDEFFDVSVVQLVKVLRGGAEVKMSKRAGEFVTLRDLVEEVGPDAARYFFLMRRGDAQLNFDLDLATRQTDENPVFYVQMAHARVSGIFRVAGVDPESAAADVRLDALPAPEDRELLKKLTAFPDVTGGRARAGAAPDHRLPRGARAAPRVVPQVPRPRRAARDGAGAAAPGARHAHRPGQRPHPPRPHGPRPDVTR